MKRESKLQRLVLRKSDWLKLRHLVNSEIMFATRRAEATHGASREEHLKHLSFLTGLKIALKHERVDSDKFGRSLV